jgi:hypothetical protein
MVKTTNYKAPHYAGFSFVLLLSLENQYKHVKASFPLYLPRK